MVLLSLSSIVFQPTPSLRRATVYDVRDFIRVSPISTHALLAEGDLALDARYYNRKISTHALLAEGDGSCL